MTRDEREEEEITSHRELLAMQLNTMQTLTSFADVRFACHAISGKKDYVTSQMNVCIGGNASLSCSKVSSTDLLDCHPLLSSRRGPDFLRSPGVDFFPHQDPRFAEHVQ